MWEGRTFGQGSLCFYSSSSGFGKKYGFLCWGMLREQWWVQKKEKLLSHFAKRKLVVIIKVVLGREGCILLREVGITETYSHWLVPNSARIPVHKDHSPSAESVLQTGLSPLNTHGGQAPVLRTEFQKDKQDLSKLQMSKHISFKVLFRKGVGQEYKNQDRRHDLVKK